MFSGGQFKMVVLLTRKCGDWKLLNLLRSACHRWFKVDPKADLGRKFAQVVGVDHPSA